MSCTYEPLRSMEETGAQRTMPQTDHIGTLFAVTFYSVLLYGGEKP